MISLKNIVSSEKTPTKAYNTELFAGDRESIESLSKDYFNLVSQIDSTLGKYDMKETALAIDTDNIPFLINVRASSYNGDKQVNISVQQLTLKGFNYFYKKSDLMKNDEIDASVIDYYNLELKNNSFDFSYHDVLELAELKTDLNCSILKLETDEANYYITITIEGFLSKITKKLKQETKKQDEAEKEQKSIIASLFS
jgi:hypothetical protein